MQSGGGLTSPDFFTLAKSRTQLLREWAASQGLSTTPSNSEFLLLKKLAAFYSGESCRCYTSEHQLLKILVQSLGGSPFAGESLYTLWKKIAFQSGVSLSSGGGGFGITQIMSNIVQAYANQPPGGPASSPSGPSALDPAIFSGLILQLEPEFFSGTLNDGDPVSSLVWEDQSVSQNDATRTGSPGAGMKFIEDFAGGPGLTAVGASSVQMALDSNITITGDWTFATLAAIPAGANVWIMRQTGTGSIGFYWQLGSDRAQMSGTVTGGSIWSQSYSAVILDTLTPHVIFWRFDSSEGTFRDRFKLRLNKTNVLDAGSAGVFTSINLDFLYANSSGGTFNGTHGPLLFWNSFLTDGDCDQLVDEYFSVKHPNYSF